MGCTPRTVSDSTEDAAIAQGIGARVYAYGTNLCLPISRPSQEIAPRRESEAGGDRTEMDTYLAPTESWCGQHALELDAERPRRGLASHSEAETRSSWT